MRKSILSKLLLLFCSITFLRRIVSHVAMRLEGGTAFSETLREILAKYYGTKVGRFSYGSLVHPGAVANGTQIGAYCSFANNITVIRRDHPLDRLSQHPIFYNRIMGFVKKDTCFLPSDNPLTIADDVWIGCNVVIGASCRQIGYSSVIAAGAVVIEDVPPFAIVGGVPARVLKWKFDESLRNRIRLSNWCSLDESTIRSNLSLFAHPLDSHTLEKIEALQKTTSIE